MLRITRVLVPTDFSECGDAALPVAESIAKLHGAEILLVHALPSLETDAFLDLHDILDPARTLEVLARRSEIELRQRVSHLGVPARARVVPSMGSPGVTIASCARDLEVQLIVMATHGRRGLGRSLLGSVSEDVLRRSPCPLLMVRPEGARRADPRVFRNILVPIDFSWCSRMALTYARGLATTHDAQVSLLHVIGERPIPGFFAITPQMNRALRREAEVEAGKRLRELSEEVTERNAGIVLRFGHPALEILRFARASGCDLILMASHGVGGLMRLMLGSITTGVVHGAPCPVLVTAWGENMTPSARVLATHYPEVATLPEPAEPIDAAATQRWSRT